MRFSGADDRTKQEGERGGVETQRSKGRINVFPWQPRQKRSLLRWLLWKSWRVCVCVVPQLLSRERLACARAVPPLHTQHTRGREEQGGTGRRRIRGARGQGRDIVTSRASRPQQKTDPVTLAIFWWLTFWIFFHVIVIIVG